MQRENVTVYKTKKSMMGGGLVVLVITFVLTLSHFVEGLRVTVGEATGLSVFWVIGIVLTILPLSFRLEVGDNFVKTYFFRIRLRNLQATNIKTLEYGNIFRFGGLGAGKGIKGWERTPSGGNKYFSIGESAYGKEAIAHAKRVLEGNG